MAEIKSLLDDVIEQEIQGIESLTSGSDEKSSAIKDLATLHKLRIEEIKAMTEADELALKERELNCKDVEQTAEKEFQIRQVREQKIDRCVKNCVTVGELVLPLIFYGVWMNKGFKFEESGVFTSTTFKNLFNRFRPTK